MHFLIGHKPSFAKKLFIRTFLKMRLNLTADIVTVLFV